MNPHELRYSTEHEWVRVVSDREAAIGITEFAAESLGDVVFLNLPKVDEELVQFEKLGEIEDTSTTHRPTRSSSIAGTGSCSGRPRRSGDQRRPPTWT